MMLDYVWGVMPFGLSIELDGPATRCSYTKVIRLHHLFTEQELYHNGATRARRLLNHPIFLFRGFASLSFNSNCDLTKGSSSLDPGTFVMTCNMFRISSRCLMRQNHDISDLYSAFDKTLRCKTDSPFLAGQSCYTVILKDNVIGIIKRSVHATVPRRVL